MTQRGLRLRREVATMRQAARAISIVAALLAAAPILLPVAAFATAPAVTRTRNVKAHHEAAQPVAVAAKAGSREKRAAGKVRPAVAAREKAEPVRRGNRSRIAVQWAAAHGRERGTQQEYTTTAMSQAAMRRAELERRGQEAGWREIAERKARSARAASAGGPQDAASGGELTMDDFLRVAAANADGSPMVAPANRRTTPTVQRVDGFGAEGAVLATPRSGAEPAAEAPDAVVASAAAGDSRVRALVHPSHEEMAEELAVPVVLPGLYRNGRLLVPAPLKGSHDILVHQNAMADDEGLERVRDEADLQRLRASRQLVDFLESASLRVNPELGPDRRCARVWTVQFAEDTARAFYARFHEPLQVNSAVRTVAYQLRLQRTNGNAAGIRGETSSPHLTGQAIDFGKRGMSVEQIAWMRATLGPLMAAGKVDVEEEFQQACFHISVYKSYLPPAPAVRRIQVAAAVRPIVDTR